MSLLPSKTQASAQVTDSFTPESATARQQSQVVTARHTMVVTANPHATNAALAILKLGGSAVDAMVSAQLVLGLVEPQSSGIGGGAFMLYFDQHKQQLLSYDGRETAPSNIPDNIFIDKDGKPLPFFEAVVGGRSVGVPGVIALMAKSHQQHGKLPWQTLFQPAIELAQKGFVVSPRLHTLLTKDAARLSQDEAAKAYFYDNQGNAVAAGATLKNPAYAHSLTLIAKQGTAGFYQGPLAKAMVDKVSRHTTNPGYLSMQDMQEYQAKLRSPVCSDYRQVKVCGMGLPSSGGLTVNQSLALLANSNLAEMGPNSPESWRLIGEASRLAFADRGKYMADPDFYQGPNLNLLAPEYIRQRQNLLQPGGKARAAMPPGQPDMAMPQANLSAEVSIEQPSTTHFAIRDQAGNLVSMTSSIENVFGSRLMVGGFLLNNQLTDFAFSPKQAGLDVANKVAPGKRPRSSMAPTIVFKSNQPYLVIGSPGGSRIINYVLTTLIAHLDWGMTLQQAIELPHMVNRFGSYELEAGTAATKFEASLKAMGYEVTVKDLNSGLHGFIIDGNSIISGVDTRREGSAATLD
ncbi:gamma-glutamyltransferase [Motilimonas pumila]|uniref:Glutathione hydrolase proenzyme n=1 Tax=Motilimonas pumila TaxID=2303987 RepID=A0A418YGI0_9GAMM|nr:gamma-glutamyltransferase [Motilimonas pumila]RJG48502.1 gamma-glutamyltransferase [Motilimonas pumila]